MWNIVHQNTPRSLAQNIITEAKARSKRRFIGGKIEPKLSPKLEGTKKIWRWSATTIWNRMPEPLRTEERPGCFSNFLKTWIKCNIPIHKPWGVGEEENSY